MSEATPMHAYKLGGAEVKIVIAEERKPWMVLQAPKGGSYKPWLDPPLISDSSLEQLGEELLIFIEDVHTYFENMAQVEALIKEYHLSKEKCHQQISDIDIDEISRSYCGKWRSLPSHLEMATIDADDVDRGPGNEEEKRRNFLLKWKHTKGSAATYVKLISALHEIRCRNDAEGVSKLIPSTPSTKIPAGHGCPKGKGSQPGADAADLPSEALIPLSENDLAEVLRFVLDILERWEDLGMALDIKIPELKVIETDKSNSRERMKAMLLVWLRGRGGDSNWKTLCEALRDKLVQRDDVAKKIELAIQKHTCM